MLPRTGGGITNKPGARYTCLCSLTEERFSLRVAFRYLIGDSFSVISLLLAWLFYQPFLFFIVAYLLLLQLRVVWQPWTQRCRYFAILSYSTVVSSSLQHVQLSRTELHGTSKAPKSRDWNTDKKAKETVPKFRDCILVCELFSYLAYQDRTSEIITSP